MKKLCMLLTVILFTACLSDDLPDIQDNFDPLKDYTLENEQEILSYIADNELVAQVSSTGLHYVINEPGTGDQPNSTSNVTVAYKGYFTDGGVFDQSDSNGISFGLNQVIAGWTEGITYFKEGGSGILLIPSHLAYGNSGQGPIPPGAVIIFDIELITVN